MINPQAPNPATPNAPAPQLLRSVSYLADVAEVSGRDTAASLLQGILRGLKVR